MAFLSWHGPHLGLSNSEETCLFRSSREDRRTVFRWHGRIELATSLVISRSRGVLKLRPLAANSQSGIHEILAEEVVAAPQAGHCASPPHLSGCNCNRIFRSVVHHHVSLFSVPLTLQQEPMLCHATPRAPSYTDLPSSEIVGEVRTYPGGWWLPL